MIYKTQLEAKVAGFNRVHAERNRLQKVFIEFFAQYVGKRIFSQSRLFKRINDKLPEVSVKSTNGFDGFTIFRMSSDYRLAFHVRCSETMQGNSWPHQVAVYAETDFYVGSVDKGILTKLAEASELPTDYTVEKIKELRRIAEEIQEAARKADSALYPFGKFDR